LSVPVFLMVIVAGAALSYYVLSSNGWSWNVAPGDFYRRLPIASRALVIAGLVLNAWGLGSLWSALARKKSDD
jgi:hypothetical protein